MRFLEEIYDNDVSSINFPDLIKAFFTYLENNTPEHLNDQLNHVSTAKDRAVKAIEYAAEGKNIAASKEWRKIFGSYFPLADKDEEQKSQSSTIVNPAKPWGRKF